MISHFCALCVIRFVLVIWNMRLRQINNNNTGCMKSQSFLKALFVCYALLNTFKIKTRVQVYGLEQGRQILLAVDPLVKSQTFHRPPNELTFSDPNPSHIRGHLHYCILLYSALAASIKHYTYTGTSTKKLTWGRDAEKPEGYLVKVSLKIV